MAEPQFVQFVSAAPGRLVSRSDSPQSFIGARRATEEEARASGERIVWDLEQVVALTGEYCARYGRDLQHQLRNGDLIERSEADYRAWLEFEQERDAAANGVQGAEETTADAPKGNS